MIAVLNENNGLIFIFKVFQVLKLGIRGKGSRSALTIYYQQPT